MTRDLLDELDDGMDGCPRCGDECDCPLDEAPEVVRLRARVADLESLVGCFYSDGFRAIENGRQVDPTFVMALALQSGLDFAPDGKPSVAKPRCHCCGLTLSDCTASGCGAHRGRSE